MSPTLTCLALALVGVDLGYQPAPNGGEQFIIQINPNTLQAIRPGDRYEIDVPREAQDSRPTHFTVSLGNETLPRKLPVAATAPPATAPIVTASPVMPAVAAVPAPSLGSQPGNNPLGVPPPATYALKSSVAHVKPLLNPGNSASGTASSANSIFGGLAPVNGGSNSGQPDKPWLGMCLFVIALAASNVYVGWLFWDARQRYRGLLARTFAMAQPAAEA